MVNSNIIKKIYSQNIDYSLPNTKLNLLPIGIANSMWKHGNLVELYSTIKRIREKYYILFITNISTQIIIRNIMLKLLNVINNIEIKYKIIDITSIFEQRLSQGTRHIIHIEAYISRLIELFTNNKITDHMHFDTMEI